MEGKKDQTAPESVQVDDDVFVPNIPRQITPRERFWKKFHDHPLVPLGAGATAIVLTLGLVSMKRNRPAEAQKFMRARVIAQGFTLAAIVYSVAVPAAKSDA